MICDSINDDIFAYYRIKSGDISVPRVHETSKGSRVVTIPKALAIKHGFNQDVEVIWVEKDDCLGLRRL